MNRFRVVATGDAIEGMCLYDDVRDGAGNVLLPGRTMLTGAMLRSLQRRNIEALQVIDDSVTPERLADERLRAQGRLSYLCRHAGEGRANVLLRQVVEQYRMVELS